MHSFDLSIRGLSKIEGSAKLSVKVKNGKVIDSSLKLIIEEYKRFFTQGVRGKNITEAPQWVSRICGTCSIAHHLCCIEAIEKALDVKVSEQTRLLRRAMYNGLIIRDHALHLYVFVLPDLIGKDSILDFDDKNEREHELLHDMFDVKKTGNELSTWIGGRCVHAITPIIGGFSILPDENKRNEIIKNLQDVRKAVLKLIELFFNNRKAYNGEKDDFMALVASEFNFIEGKICSTKGICVEEADFGKHLRHIILPYSEASSYIFEDKAIMVGALARLNLNKEGLNERTKKDAGKYLNIFPSNNVFDNNIAQAIEILHCVDDSIGVLKKLKIKNEKLVEVNVRESEGVGVIEAPRGTLYYWLKIDNKGIIKDSHIIVPTGINQIKIERDVRRFIENNLNLGKEKLKKMIEELIRSYDPCMSCASHFLEFEIEDG